MNKRIERLTFDNKRLLSTKEVAGYLGMGTVRAREYMDKIGATRKFGRRVLFDKTVIDKALSDMGE